MPDCECEGQQQSEHSPGVVQAGEGIVYCLIHPVDITDPVTFAQASGLMPSKQLVACTLSVCRAVHSTRETVQREVIDVQLARREGRTFLGCWSVFCQRLRELSDEHGRTICVVDDGYETYPGHATIGFSQTVAAAPKNVQTAAKACSHRHVQGSRCDPVRRLHRRLVAQGIWGAPVTAVYDAFFAGVLPPSGAPSAHGK